MGRIVFSCMFVCNLDVLSVYFGFFTGLTILSLRKQRSYHAGRKLDISGSVIAAMEPYLLSYSGDELTLWDQRDEHIVQNTTEGHQVVGALSALKDIHAGWLTLVRYRILFKGEIICS